MTPLKTKVKFSGQQDESKTFNPYKSEEFEQIFKSKSVNVTIKDNQDPTKFLKVSNPLATSQEHDFLNPQLSIEKHTDFGRVMRDVLEEESNRDREKLRKL